MCVTIKSQVFKWSTQNHASRMKKPKIRNYLWPGDCRLSLTNLHQSPGFEHVAQLTNPCVFDPGVLVVAEPEALRGFAAPSTPCASVRVLAALVRNNKKKCSEKDMYLELLGPCFRRPPKSWMMLPLVYPPIHSKEIDKPTHQQQLHSSFDRNLFEGSVCAPTHPHQNIGRAKPTRSQQQILSAGVSLILVCGTSCRMLLKGLFGTVSWSPHTACLGANPSRSDKLPQNG